jgi:hypothetical protein
VIDPSIKRFATFTQAKYIDAVIAADGNIAKAARELGVDRSAISRCLKTAKENAAIRGIAPEGGMTHEAPSPFIVKGVSSLYDEEGKLKVQWVKTRLDESRALEAVKEWIESLAKETKGLSPLVKSPKNCSADLLAVYPFGDPHIGMYAWAKECGDDFDLEEAERLTLGAVDRLVETAPNADTAIILPLGDVFHANDQSNVTPGHKHQLDVDSRYPKVINVGIQVFRRAILRALEKHNKVICRVEPGNHDPEAKWALAFALAAYFENNPRVDIDLSPSKFWFYKFGKVLVASTHGDTIKHQGLLGVMAASRPEDWGATKYRYWYTGHVHNQGVTELPGVVCESFRTLAAKDAFAAGHGYLAGRDMRLIVHHKDFGEIERHRCDVAMIQ